MDESERHLHSNPILRANPFSRLFFCWLNPLFKEGYKRKLEVDDMYNVVPEDTSSVLCDKLEKNWEAQKTKLKYGKKPSLRNAALKTFGPKLAVYGIVVFMEEATKVVQPLLLGGLIRYFTPGSGVTRFDAFMLALGLSLCAMILAIVHHPYFYGMQKIGMQLRIASCSLIYKKSLRLSNGALGKTTTGHIVNLLSNDVNRFDLSTLFLHFLWVGPLQAIAVLVILWLKLGVASVAGFSVLLLLIPLQSYMGKLFSKLRRKTAVQTDQRVRIMNEILTGVRVIKMYCWEKLFGELVKKVRQLEVECVKKVVYAVGYNATLFFSSAKVIAFAIFVAYSCNHTLLAEVVFVTIGLLNPVRLTMTLFLPYAVRTSSEGAASLKRIQVNKPVVKSTGLQCRSRFLQTMISLCCFVRYCIGNFLSGSLIIYLIACSFC